jgi:hypothetical protein
MGKIRQLEKKWTTKQKYWKLNIETKYWNRKLTQSCKTRETKDWARPTPLKSEVWTQCYRQVSTIYTTSCYSCKKSGDKLYPVIKTEDKINNQKRGRIVHCMSPFFQINSFISNVFVFFDFFQFFQN